MYNTIRPSIPATGLIDKAFWAFGFLGASDSGRCSKRRHAVQSALDDVLLLTDRAGSAPALGTKNIKTVTTVCGVEGRYPLQWGRSIDCDVSLGELHNAPVNIRRVLLCCMYVYRRTLAKCRLLMKCYICGVSLWFWMCLNCL